MTTQAKSYRFQFPKKALKSDCPDCAPQHRNTLSRYVDTQTNEPLPDIYGRCDRESNCGYHLSPYSKGPTGTSYAEELRQGIPKEWFKLAAKWKHAGSTQVGITHSLQTMEGASTEQAERVAAYVFEKRPTPNNLKPVYSLPDKLFLPSLGQYEKNQFASLLHEHFGFGVATQLLQQFQIGTSSYWPGACVFWYIDEQNRKRGGQIKLFGDDWHTIKYLDRNGEKRSKTSWVHSALLHRYRTANNPIPDWLTAYEQHAERSPCLFGLPQLESAPIDQPIAIVEAPKTAVVCTPYFPEFTWLAVGALSYLNAERLTPLRGRKIVLFPDLNAYADWSRRAELLAAAGFQIEVSDLLERVATDQQRADGLDLADFLLGQPPDPPQPSLILDGQTIVGEVLDVKPCNSYPADWDAPGIPPTLIVSPNRSQFAQHLGMVPNQVPLYSLAHIIPIS
ncbi:DUF6371 domain-containing protein [Spirosoma migulaei]